MFLSSMPKVNSYLSQVLAVQQRRNFSGILSEIIKISHDICVGVCHFYHSIKRQEAQLSQTGRAQLCVVKILLSQ